jgi:hypothetical protein
VTRWLFALGLLAACSDSPSGPDGGSGPVAVLAPNGGEALVAAEPFELRWTGAGPFDLDLIEAGGAATPIARDVAENTLTWAPPGVPAPAGFRVRVTARGDAGEDTSDEEFTISPPATGTSLARDVQPIFTMRCNTRFCHGADSQVAQLNLGPGAPHASLVGVRSATQACGAQIRVRPGMPDQSYLLWKLAGTGPCFTGVRMPKNAAPLVAAEVNIIRAWISEGAKHN